VDLLEENIDTVNPESLIDACREIRLEIGKAKYMLLSRHQNAGQNLDIKLGNRSLENVLWFKYTGTTVTNRNFM
jgi:hypothetical protein